MRKLITIILLLRSLMVNAQTIKNTDRIRVFNKDHTKSWWESSKPGFISDTAVYKKNNIMAIDYDNTVSCHPNSIGHAIIIEIILKDKIRNIDRVKIRISQ